MKIAHNDKEYDLTKLKAHELVELRLIIENENDSIKDQLEVADESPSKMYSDRNWYRSATRAKKHRIRIIQAINAEQTRRKSERRERGQSVPQYFVDAARELLNQDQFGEIMDLANDNKRYAENLEKM